MKKTLGIISHRPAMAEFYGAVFRELFGDSVEIYTGAAEDESLRQMPSADLYLSSLTSYDMLQDSRIQQYVERMTPAIRMDVTFSRAAVDLLRTYPEGTKALLVNQNKHMVMECIAQLYHLGISNIEFYPCYPGIDHPSVSGLTFTVGEPDLVPEFAGRVIDIGSRLPTANVICEVALKLGNAFFLEGKRFKKYRNRLASVDYSLETISYNNLTAENRLELILNALEEGIVCFNERNEVTLINKTAREMLGVSRSEVLGRHIQTALPELPFDPEWKTDFDEPRLLAIRDLELGARLMPLKLEEKTLGAFMTLQQFRETERRQSSLRRQKTHRSRETGGRFEDIIGDGTAISRVRDLAKRMARSEAAILIQGESGTGKSLFASAIHNASPRAGEAFIPVNCAAMPDERLELELFGDKVSADKDASRPGLIECAHRGTLYLENVEQMSPRMQACMLQVLEDGAFLRPGETEPVPVDIRVLSSTGEDLLRLVREGRFRRDLYYRLNVISLHIPALREHREDILKLVYEFRRRQDADFDLTNRARQALIQHYWEGNVRELKNCVEYLGYTGLHTVDFDDLPQAVRISGEHVEQREELERRSGLTQQEYLVLKQLGENYREKTGLGRRMIVARCLARGEILSEHEARAALNRLSELGYAEVRPGRGGSKLTEKGYLNYRRILYGEETG